MDKKKAKKKNKARGRGSVKNETRAQTRIMFERTRDTKRSQMVADFQKAKEEKDKVEGDLAFLEGIEEKFDPITEAAGPEGKRVKVNEESG